MQGNVTSPICPTTWLPNLTYIPGFYSAPSGGAVASATLTLSAGSTPSSTPSLSSTPAAEVSPTSSHTPTGSLSPSAAAGASVTSSLTPSGTSTAAGASPTSTPTPTGTSSLTATPTSSISDGASPSSSPSNSGTPTASSTLSASASVTASCSPTSTMTPTPTGSLGASVSGTSSLTPPATPSITPSISNSPTGSLSNGASPSPSGVPDALVVFELTFTAATVTSPLLAAVQVLANALQLRRDISKYAKDAVTSDVCATCPPPTAFVSAFGSPATPSFEPAPAINASSVWRRRLADTAVVGISIAVPAPRDAGSYSTALSQQAAAVNSVVAALNNKNGLDAAIAASRTMIDRTAGTTASATASDVASNLPAAPVLPGPPAPVVPSSSTALLALLVLIPIAALIALVLMVRLRGHCCGFAHPAATWIATAGGAAPLSKSVSAQSQRALGNGGAPPCQPPPTAVGVANPIARTLAATGVAFTAVGDSARNDPSAPPLAPAGAPSDSTKVAIPSLRAHEAAPVTYTCPHTGDPYILDSSGEPLWLDGVGGRPLAKGWRRYADETDTWYAKGDVTEWTPEYA